MTLFSLVIKLSFTDGLLSSKSDGPKHKGAGTMLLRLPKKQQKKKAVGRVESWFHGVEIESPGECCEAIHALVADRYLSGEAPTLPVAGCDQPGRCACRYKKFTDRRTDLRRESDVGLPVRAQPHDKRDGLGRRITY